MRWRFLHYTFFALIAAVSVQGHGDVHEAIAALTKRIESTPNDAALYLSRGDLHRQHGDWPAAARDFDTAEKLAPTLFAVDLARGQMLADAGRDAEARAALDRFIAHDPANPLGYVARARALMKAAQASAAAEDFSAALAHSSQPEAGLFIEYARALRSAGNSEEALRALDRGMAIFGPLIPLALEAVDFEEVDGHFGTALERVDRILPSVPRKERLLVRRAALLEKLARPQQAREALLAAKSALETLPAERRKSAALSDLITEIDTALRRLGGG